MRNNPQRPMRWYMWVPLLLLLPLGRLLILELQGPRSLAGHPIAQLMLALLMYGVVVLLLWGIRWVFTREEQQHRQHQERMHMVRQQQQELTLHTQEPRDDVWRPWQTNGDSTHPHRRR
jgi:hypothetical protein